MAHTGHHAAKSADRGKNPADPEGPAEGEKHVGLRPPGNAEIARSLLHVYGFRRNGYLPGYGVGQRAGVGSQRKTGAQTECERGGGDAEHFFHDSSGNSNY